MYVYDVLKFYYFVLQSLWYHHHIVYSINSSIYLLWALSPLIIPQGLEASDTFFKCSLPPSFSLLTVQKSGENIISCEHEHDRIDK